MPNREHEKHEVSFRKDDGAIVFKTTAYVSHRKGYGAWPSYFSMTMDKAVQIRDELSKLIEQHGEASL